MRGAKHQIVFRWAEVTYAFGRKSLADQSLIGMLDVIQLGQLTMEQSLEQVSLGFVYEAQTDYACLINKLDL